MIVSDVGKRGLRTFSATRAGGVLKRILLRVLLYPVVVVAGACAMVFTLDALPWLPAAFIIAFFGLAFVACAVLAFVHLVRVLAWLSLVR
ncbi:MAG: hypothetical protein GXC76_01905 [Rhodanobacteraceae bacterium]|jgi:Na+/phosphate symporter|nr:hypothetical protein [Rhodanobacteraceae bacterium]